MTIEINDITIIKQVLDFYRDDLNQGVLHPRTKEIIYIDEANQAQRIDCLNMALFQPAVIMVWGSDLAYSQLEIWSTILKKSKLKHAIFCKSLKGKPQSFAKLDNVPIFGLKDGNDTKLIANFSSAASSMLYMTDKNENFGYIRSYPNLVHVAAHHGDSDKHASFNRLFGAFDYLLVADKNSMNRYLSANIQLTPDHFLTIGNSVIEGVKCEQRKVLKNILFAPTFEGHGESVNYSSLKRTQHNFDDLGEFNLMLRPHPGSGLRDPQYKKIAEKLSIQSVDDFKKNKMRQFNWSDILICDISGILSEYLFTGKPIVVPVSIDDGWLYKYIFNLDIKNYVYFWDYKNTSLQALIESIQKDDYLHENRLKRRQELFCGVEDIDQSVELYDKAMDYLSHVKFWRDLKSSKTVNTSKQFVKNPADPILKEIIEGIRAGKYILKSNIS